MQKKYFSSQRQKGFTLLELLLVLIIVAVITFLAINRYQLYRREKDIDALKANINLLLQATNNYYHICCSASQGINSTCGGPGPNNQFTVSIAALKKQNLMPTLLSTFLIQNAADYNVQATYLGKTQQTQKPIYQLSATVILNVPTGTIQTYQQILGASQISSTNSSQLEWIRLPSYMIQSTTSDLWVLNTGLRQFKEGATLQVGDDSCGY